MINVGIIGLGTMGRIRFDAIEASGRARVVGVTDAVRGAVPPGVQWFATPEELIESRALDTVFICTPNHLNQPLTIAALRRGKHVFCEKPPAFTAAEVESIRDVEMSVGRKLMYGFNHRHHDSVIKAKQLIDSGAYGRLLWMRGRYGKSVDESFFSTWRAQKALAGGGILIDQGIHMLDLFLMMAGDFDEVYAVVSSLFWKLDVEDNVFAIFRNRSGVVASLHSTMTQWRHLFSFEIFLERGYIVINGLLTSSGSYGEETMSIARNRTVAPAATWKDEDSFTFDVNNSWKYEVEHFLHAIQTDTPVTIGTSTDALKLMRVVDRVYENPRRADQDAHQEHGWTAGMNRATAGKHE